MLCATSKKLDCKNHESINQSTNGCGIAAAAVAIAAPPPVQLVYLCSCSTCAAAQSVQLLYLCSWFNRRIYAFDKIDNYMYSYNKLTVGGVTIVARYVTRGSCSLSIEPCAKL